MPGVKQSDPASWECLCSTRVKAPKTLCPACNRFRWETLDGCPAPTESREPAPRSPRRYSRLPLVLLVVLVAALTWYFRGERELAWEVMPVLTSRPVGEAVKVKSILVSGRNFRANLHIRLRDLKMVWAGDSVQESGQADLQGHLFFRSRPGTEGSRTSGPTLALERLSLTYDNLSEEFEAWMDSLEVLLKLQASIPRPVPAPFLRALKMLEGRSFRMGEAESAEFDAARPGSYLGPNGRFGVWRLWLGYSVEQRVRSFLGFKVRGGGRLELPESRGVPAMAVRLLTGPLGKPAILRARLEGMVRVNHRTGIPARSVFHIRFEILGEKEGRPYTLTGDVYIEAPGWVRLRTPPAQGSRKI